MTDQIDELSRKIEKAKGVRADSPENLKNDNAAQGKEMSEGLRFAVELMAGVAVGAFIGYGLDKLCGTIPLFLIIFILLGAAAGFWAIYKSTMKG